MKVILDEKQCLRKKLSLQEALIATAFTFPGFIATLNGMAAKGIISSTGTSLTPEWEKTIKSMTTSDDDHLRQLAQQMKECYPKGKKPGTVFYFRCNEREVIMKLKKFLETHAEEYTDEQIIKATKKFVASFRGDYRLMPLLKYFISKNKTIMDEDGNSHVMEVSELASTLENMEDDEGIPEIENSDDWLMSSRN